MSKLDQGVLAAPYKGLQQCSFCGTHSTYDELKKPEEKRSNRTAQGWSLVEIAAKGLLVSDRICPVCDTLMVREGS